MTSAFLAQGHVFHGREEGVKNRFRYNIFYVLFKCSDEASFQSTLKQRYKGLLSFRGQDYLRGETGPVETSVRNFLREECSYEAEEIWLHTMPRMFGYAFNPVSFWLCRRNNQLEAVLCEVNNTFGERHFYWIHPSQGIQKDVWLESQKVFHVSPFFPVEGFYKFRFDFHDDHFRVDINYHAPDRKLRLATWTQGKLAPLGSQSPWSLLLRYGWMTPLVVLRIHTQALRLWLHKTRFYKKPERPSKEVTR